MPVYVYKNLTTGATFEVEQRITESALVADPVSGDPVKRLIQPVGIAFKGSGFYVTDSRGKKPGPATSKSESSKTDLVKVDGAKSDGGSSGAGASASSADAKAPAATKPSVPASSGG